MRGKISCYFSLLVELSFPLPHILLIVHAKMLVLILCGVLLSFFQSVTSTNPLSNSLPSHGKRDSSANSPVLQSNFPDPGWIKSYGSNIYVAFSSNSAGINVPVATSTDFETWIVATGLDALPYAGKWTSGDVQAPDVIQLVCLGVLPTSEVTQLMFAGGWHVCHVLLRPIGKQQLGLLCWSRHL